MSVDELETAIQEVVTTMINNDDVFVEGEEGDEVEEKDIFSDDESANLGEMNTMNLNMSEFRERNEEVGVNLNIEIQPRVHDL